VNNYVYDMHSEVKKHYLLFS